MLLSIIIISELGNENFLGWEEESRPRSYFKIKTSFVFKNQQKPRLSRKIFHLTRTMFAKEGEANGGLRRIGFVLRGRVDWVKEGHCLCLMRLHRGGMRRQEAIKLHCTERTIGFS